MTEKEQGSQESKVVGYVWSYQVSLGTGRTLSIQGNFALDAEEIDMSRELDKIGRVVERQQAFAMIPSAEEEVAKYEVILDDSYAQLKKLTDRTDGVKNVPTTDRQSIETLRSNIENTKLRLKLQRDVLDNHRKKVA